MQRISTKHHDLGASGINVVGRSMALKRNYRNSREILSAAYEVLKANVNLEEIQDDDFEILDPEYANFSTPKPLLLRAESPQDEIAHALAYLTEKVKEGNSSQKTCIAVAGLDFISVKLIGEKLGLPVLDGNINIQDNRVFVSDLSQMKGYEFDSVCIINCSADVLPDPNQPSAESFRDLSRLYVAMTRAKQELILSYSGSPTQFLAMSQKHLTLADWGDHSAASPVAVIDFSDKGNSSTAQFDLELSGEDFLYTKQAVGLHPRIQEQLLSTVTGKRSLTGRTQTEWRTIRELLRHERQDRPAVARAFGIQSFEEFKQWLRGKGYQV